MKPLPLFLALFAIVFDASAHNSLFFPGDAYFSSRWGIDSPLGEKADEVTLEYALLSNMLRACGYAGCKNIKVVGLSEKLKANLVIVHARLFTEFVAFSELLETRIEEGKPPMEARAFHVFIYNKDYDFKTLPMGLRFNEDWMTLQTEDAKKEPAIYEGPNDRDLVVTDWTKAKTVAPLKLAGQPESLEEFMGVEEPVIANAAELIFVIPLTEDMEAFAKGVPGLRFLVVGEEVHEYVFTSSGVEDANGPADAKRLLVPWKIGKGEPLPVEDLFPSEDPFGIN